jgi:4-hydroxy-3-polyprenylbenzoate decarboxylase
MVPPEVETRMEGPFGEYCGYYASHASPEVVFRVKSILHRNDPILLGDPPFRVWPIYWWGRNIARAAVMWDRIETTVPGIEGVWVIEEATVNVPVVSIKQMYAGQAKDAGIAAKAAYNGLTRFVIVVDEDIDPSNLSDVIWALGTRWDPATGIDILLKTTTNIKDPLLTAEQRKQNNLYTNVGIITACKPFGWIDQFPKTIQSSKQLRERVEEKWADLLKGA